MANVQPKNGLRPITPEERTKVARDPLVARVYAEVLLRLDKIENAARAIEQDIGTEETRTRRAREKVDQAVKESNAAGRRMSRAEFEWLQMTAVNGPTPFTRAYYAEAQRVAREVNLRGPDIDQVEDVCASPGGGVVLVGTGFGPPQGKVCFEVASGLVIELEVSTWTETRIEASVNSVLGDAALRPYLGALWLTTGAGERSNTWPLKFEPVYSEYMAIWRRNLVGYIGGNHADGVFLENCGVGDPDFTVRRVEASHRGRGWSELRHPFAGGGDMAQGYHMGIDWIGEGWMTLRYVMKGPKGISPPFVEPLGQWAYLGDV